MPKDVINPDGIGFVEKGKSQEITIIRRIPLERSSAAGCAASRSLGRPGGVLDGAGSCGEPGRGHAGSRGEATGEGLQRPA